MPARRAVRDLSRRRKYCWVSKAVRNSSLIRARGLAAEAERGTGRDQRLRSGTQVQTLCQFDLAVPPIDPPQDQRRRAGEFEHHARQREFKVVAVADVDQRDHKSMKSVMPQLSARHLALSLFTQILSCRVSTLNIGEFSRSD